MSNEETTTALRSLSREYTLRGNTHYAKALRSQSSPKWVETMGTEAMVKVISIASAGL